MMPVAHLIQHSLHWLPVFWGHLHFRFSPGRATGGWRVSPGRFPVSVWPLLR